MNTKVNTDGIIYVPQYDTYRIKVGKIIVEVPARTLRQAHSIDMVERTLKVGNDRLKNDLLDSIVRMGGRLMGRRLADDFENNGYASSHDPIDALYRGPIDPRDTVVACMDLPKPTPYYDPNAAPTIYYNDRFPSKPPMVIIEEALELLNSKKHLGIKKIELSKEFGPIIRLTIASDAAAEIPGYKRILSVRIEYKAFDRAYNMETDRDAGLTAKLDTDTYIKLRIAFLINQALKRAETLALATVLDVFKVIGSFDR